MSIKGQTDILGIFIAIGVTLATLAVILLSKLNDVRKQRMPRAWKSKLKRMVIQSARRLKLAEEVSPNPAMSYLYAIEANTMLESAIDLVGISHLQHLTNYDIEKLSRDISHFLEQTVQRQQGIYPRVHSFFIHFFQELLLQHRHSLVQIIIIYILWNSLPRITLLDHSGNIQRLEGPKTIKTTL